MSPNSKEPASRNPKASPREAKLETAQSGTLQQQSHHTSPATALLQKSIESIATLNAMKCKVAPLSEKSAKAFIREKYNEIKNFKKLLLAPPHNLSALAAKKRVANAVETLEAIKQEYSLTSHPATPSKAIPVSHSTTTSPIETGASIFACDDLSPKYWNPPWHGEPKELRDRLSASLIKNLLQWVREGDALSRFRLHHADRHEEDSYELTLYWSGEMPGQCFLLKLILSCYNKRAIVRLEPQYYPEQDGDETEYPRIASPAPLSPKYDPYLERTGTRTEGKAITNTDTHQSGTSEHYDVSSNSGPNGPQTGIASGHGSNRSKISGTAETGTDQNTKSIKLLFLHKKPLSPKERTEFWLGQNRRQHTLIQSSIHAFQIALKQILNISS